MIDPEFWTDEEVGGWPEIAQLFYIGLWNFADDEGRLKAHPKLLKAEIFPYKDNVDIEKIKEIVKTKVLWYEIDGQQYGFIKNFSKHQQISHPSKSKIPAPTEEMLKEFNYGHSMKTPGSLNEDSMRTPPQFNLKEFNLKEDNIKKDSPDTYDKTSKKDKKSKITFNFELACWENITDKDMELWQEAYPAVNIGLALSQMKNWIIDHPEKRKKNWRAFISRWLSREQERGGTGYEKAKLNKKKTYLSPEEREGWRKSFEKNLRKSIKDEAEILEKLSAWDKEYPINEGE